MRIHHFFLGFIFTTLTAVTACSSGGASTTTDTSPTEAQTFCDRSCQHLSECKAGDPAVSCTVNCQKDYDRVFSRMYPDARSGLLDCIVGATCQELNAEGSGTVCLDRVMKDLPQRASVEEMCRVVGDALKACNGRLDEASCRTAKLFSDEMIADARSCSERPCAEIPTCFKTVFSL